MGHHEKVWLEMADGGPTFYRRYVDDIFLTFENEECALSFLDYLNNRHPNIKFTKDGNLKPGVLPFLDVLIKNQGKLVTSVYHKDSYTGLLTNFRSFIPHVYKRMLVNTLTDRTFKINNTWHGFDLDIKKMTSFLCKNMFPIKMVEDIIRKYLNKKMTENVVLENDKKEIRISYLKLPYIGIYSGVAKQNLQKLLKRYCKVDVDLKLVFSTCKVKDYFSQKDELPSSFKSHVVYKFNCAHCNACYVGRTDRHHTTRVNEHLVSDKNSHILKHLKSNLQCKNACDENCFEILDTANSKYQLKIKEALYINWIKPDLNKQKFHSTITLCI